MNLLWPALAAILFINAGLLGLVVWRTLRQPAYPGQWAFAGQMLALTWWAFTEAGLLLTTNLPDKVFWLKLKQLGTLNNPWLWVLFSLTYMRQLPPWLPYKALVASWALPAVVFVLVAWTNDWHHAYWADLQLFSTTGGPVVGQRGPIWFIALAYCYTLLVIGVFTSLQALRRMASFYQRHFRLLLISSFIPWGLSLLYTLSQGIAPGLLLPLDLAPYGLFLIAGVYFLTTHKQPVVELAPLARALVLDSLDRALIVMDAHQRLIDLNQEAQQWLGLTLGEALGRNVPTLLPEWHYTLPALNQPFHGELTLTRPMTRYITFTLSAVSDARHQLAGYVLVARDITENKRLAQAHEWLTLERTVAEDRRRIAHETHDGVLQNLAGMRLRLDYWRRLLDTQPAQMHAELNELDAVLTTSMSDMRRLIFALRPLELDQDFSTVLRQWVASARQHYQLTIELTLGCDPNAWLDRDRYTLLRIIQEALTNIGKHAQATTARIHIECQPPATAHVTICDNGLGFEQSPAASGFGLRTMRERAQHAGGTLTLISQPGQGTAVSACWPLTLPDHDPKPYSDFDRR